MLNRTLTPHSMINGNACFAYFNKIWGIPGVAAGWIIEFHVPWIARHS